MSDPCPHCPDGHDNPRRKPWSVWVGPGEKPFVLHVAPSCGAHVAESDAEWLRQLIREHRSDSALRQSGTVYDCTDKSWPPSEAFLRAYSAWLAAHGIDSNETRRIEHCDHPVVAEPFIRVFQRDIFSGVDREPFNVPIKTPPPSPEDYA